MFLRRLKIPISLVFTEVIYMISPIDRRMARAAKHREKAHALKEIDSLFALAQKAALEHPVRARRYVELARKMGERQRIPLRAYNRVHCRGCWAYWTSKTLRVRARTQAVVYTCLACGALKRFRKR
jgi:RNase P subunit RPR2